MCSAPICTSDEETLASTCSNGSCPFAGDPIRCYPYACGATACITSCTADSDCAGSSLCCASAMCTPGAETSSSVTVLGGLDPSSVAVVLEYADGGSAAETTTDGDGGYALGCLTYQDVYEPLTFQKSVAWPLDAGFGLDSDGGAPTLEYAAQIPGILIDESSTTFTNQAFMYWSGFAGEYPPLAPIELPAGLQVSPPNWMNAFGEPHLTVSPDGQHVAFIGVADVSNNIVYDALWLTTVSTGDTVYLGGGVGSQGDPREVLFQFSLDSRFIAFMANWGSNGNPSTLEVAPVSSGVPLQVATNVESFLLSPDGSQVAFFSGGTLFLAPTSTGVPMQVSTDAYESGGPIQTIAFSPDGSLLAFFTNAAFPLGTITVATIADGGLVAPASNVDVSNGFAWSSDSAELAFYTSSFTDQLYDVSSGDLLNLDGGSTLYQFSPDGTHLAYGDGTGVHVTPVPDLAPILVGDAGGGVPALVFSPDSSHLAWVSNWIYDPPASTVTLNLTDLASSVTTQISSQVYCTAQNCQFFEFSPDSTSLAYLSNASTTTETGDIEVASVATGQSVQAASGVQGSNGLEVQYSPDGRYLAAIADISGQPTLQFFEIGNGQTYFFGAASGNALSPGSGFLEFMQDGSHALLQGEVFAYPSGFSVQLNNYVQSQALAGTTVVSYRFGTPGPFGFMDGVYLTPLP